MSQSVLSIQSKNTHLKHQGQCLCWGYSLPSLPVYKSTFHILHISPKNCPWLIHGSKTKIKKGSAQIFFCVPEKQNSKIKLMSFSRKFLPRYKKNLFFWLQNGGRRIYEINFYKYSRLGLAYHFCLLKYGVRLWGHFVTFIACIPHCKQYWRWAKVQIKGHCDAHENWCASKSLIAIINL